MSGELADAARTVAGCGARAACEGMWELFDSTDLFDHRQAAGICANCPLIESCGERLRTELQVGRTLRGAGGGPRGTWAGRLVGKDFRWTALPREHGTERGYQQHRYRQDQTCESCREAHRATWHRSKVAS